MTPTGRRRVYRERLLDIVEEQAAEAVRLDCLAQTSADLTPEDLQDLQIAAHSARALGLAAVTALVSDDAAAMRAVLTDTDRATRQYLNKAA